MMDSGDATSNTIADAADAADKASNYGSDYEVGYGRPPQQHQFKKGQSGNPRGRPKRKQIKPPSHPNEPFKDAFFNAAYRRVKTENGPTVTMAEAIAHSIAAKAAQGHFQSQKLFMQFITDLEQQDRKEREAFFKAAVEYKNEVEQELKFMREAGLKEPEIVPHPDHIELDPFTLSVTINGPATEQQKKRWDVLISRRDQALRTIQQASEALEKTKDPKQRKSLEEKIAFEETILEIVLDQLKPKRE